MEKKAYYTWVWKSERLFQIKLKNQHLSIPLKTQLKNGNLTIAIVDYDFL